MTRNQAKQIAKDNRFTKGELYEILERALANLPEEFWPKPNKSNPIFDNGAYFNLCKKWVGCEVGVNENEYSNEMVAFRVLSVFGAFGKIQPIRKVKSVTEIQRSEKPTL